MAKTVYDLKKQWPFEFLIALIFLLLSKIGRYDSMRRCRHGSNIIIVFHVGTDTYIIHTAIPYNNNTMNDNNYVCVPQSFHFSGQQYMYTFGFFSHPENIILSEMCPRSIAKKTTLRCIYIRVYVYFNNFFFNTSRREGQRCARSKSFSRIFFYSSTSAAATIKDRYECFGMITHAEGGKNSI